MQTINRRTIGITLAIALTLIPSLGNASYAQGSTGLINNAAFLTQEIVPRAGDSTQGTGDQNRRISEATRSAVPSDTNIAVNSVVTYSTHLPAIVHTPETVNSWPMLAANPERTSWTPEEVRGSLSIDWYRPIEPYIPYKIQPIGANGKIYVSTARGLYAFNAANGNIDWVYPTELPLGHSPTIATVNGTSVAFVGGHDRKIHAVNALTGQPIAAYSSYEAGAGFDTNPLVIQDSYTNNQPVIFAGNRDGYFYALDAVTGSQMEIPHRRPHPFLGCLQAWGCLFCVQRRLRVCVECK